MRASGRLRNQAARPQSGLATEVAAVMSQRRAYDVERPDLCVDGVGTDYRGESGQSERDSESTVVAGPAPAPLAPEGGGGGAGRRCDFEDSGDGMQAQSDELQPLEESDGPGEGSIVGRKNEVSEQAGVEQPLGESVGPNEANNGCNDVKVVEKVQTGNVRDQQATKSRKESTVVAGPAPAPRRPREEGAGLAGSGAVGRVAAPRGVRRARRGEHRRPQARGVGAGRRGAASRGVCEVVSGYAIGLVQSSHLR